MNWHKKMFIIGPDRQRTTEQNYEEVVYKWPDRSLKKICRNYKKRIFIKGAMLRCTYVIALIEEINHTVKIAVNFCMGPFEYADDTGLSITFSFTRLTEKECAPNINRVHFW